VPISETEVFDVRNNSIPSEAAGLTEKKEWIVLLKSASWKRTPDRETAALCRLGRA
jgi:hypothetical protein